MKKSKTFIAGMSLLLVLGLASCGAANDGSTADASSSVSTPDPVINVIPVTKTVKINVSSVDGATISLTGEGKQSDGTWLPGTKAVATINVEGEGKLVDWVSISGKRILPGSDGNYSFTVPNTDSELTVTLGSGAPLAHELNANDFPNISGDDLKDAEKVYGKFDELKTIISAASTINEEYEVGGTWFEKGNSSSDSLSPMNSIWGFHSKDNAHGSYSIYSNDVAHGDMTYEHYTNGPAHKEFEFGLVGENNFYSKVVDTISNDTGKTPGAKTSSDKLDLQILCEDGKTGQTSAYPAYDTYSFTDESVGKSAVHSFIGYGMLSTFFKGDSNSFNYIKKEVDASVETSDGEDPTYKYSFGTGYTITELSSTLSDDKKSVSIVISDYKDSGSTRYIRKATITIDGSYFITNVEYAFGEFEISKSGDDSITVAETPTKSNYTSYSFKKGVRSYCSEKTDLSSYCIDDFSIKFDYTMDIDGTETTYTCGGDDSGYKMQNGGKLRLSSSTKWNVTPTNSSDTIEGKCVLPEFVGVDEDDADVASVEEVKGSYSTNYYLTAKKEGTFHLLFNNFNGKIISIPVTVTAVQPVSVNSGMANEYFYAGGSIEFAPTVSPSKASQEVSVEITGDNSAEATLDKVEVKDEDDKVTGYKYKLSADKEGSVDIKITSTVDTKVSKTVTVGVYTKPTYATLKANLESYSFNLSEDFKVTYKSSYSSSTRQVYKNSSLTFSAYEDGKTYGQVHYVEKSSSSSYNYYWYYQLDKDTCDITIAKSSTLTDGKLDATELLNLTSLSGYIKITDVAAISNTALSAGFSYYTNKDTNYVTHHVLTMVDRIS